MSKFVISILVVAGTVILGFMLWSRFRGGWKIFHQRIIGISIFLYGCYLATLTGTCTVFVLPGIGAIGGGALAGAGAGWLTWVTIGTVGLATGGAGVGLGLFGMALIGFVLGAIGGAAGGFGFQTITYPLVSPFFWMPLLILGIYFCVGSRKKKKLASTPVLLPERYPDH